MTRHIHRCANWAHFGCKNFYVCPEPEETPDCGEDLCDDCLDELEQCLARKGE